MLQDSFLWKVAVRVAKWAFRQWCRVMIFFWRIWETLKYVWWQGLLRYPDVRPVSFEKEFDVADVPPEHFFRLHAVYSEMKRVVARALAYRADMIYLTVDGNGLGLQFFVDGVGRSEDFKVRMNRTMGCEMMDLFRRLAGLHGYDPTSRQHGEFHLKYQDQVEYICMLQAEWKPSGDRELRLWFREPADLPLEIQERDPQELLNKLGMRPDTIAELNYQITSRGDSHQISQEDELRPGVILVSAPQQHGFSTTFNAILKLLAAKSANQPVALERRDDYEEQGSRLNQELDATGRVRDIGQEDRIYIQTYDKRVDDKPVKWLMKVLKEELVRIVAVRHLEDDPELTTVVCNQPERERLMVAGLEAKDAVDALMEGLRLFRGEKPTAYDDRFFGAINLVLNQRLVRTLCDHCKEQYPASPQLLDELHLPPGQTSFFWKPGRPSPLPDEITPEDRPCPQCGGSGYDGQTAVIEMLVVDEAVRDAVRTLVPLYYRDELSMRRKRKQSTSFEDIPSKKEYKAKLKEIARRSGHLTLAEQGIWAAAGGITSISELRRVRPRILKDPMNHWDHDDD